MGKKILTWADEWGGVLIALMALALIMVILYHLGVLATSYPQNFNPVISLK